MTNAWEQPPANRGRALIWVLVSIVVIAALAVVGGLLWLFLNSGASPTSSNAAPAGGTVVMHSTVVESKEAEPDPVDVVTTTVRTERETPARAASQQDGLTSAGWVDNSITRCASGETLVYAGRGNNAWITFCEGGGGLRYRSWIFDGHLDQPATRRGPAEFVVNVTPSQIVVDHDLINIYTNGSLANSVRLTDVYSR